MHIVFLNPQGNFDPSDSYLTEHPDFGGQLVYVKELAIAMAEQGHKVDIVTRRMDDLDWPEFEGRVDYYKTHPHNPRILRMDCGGSAFLPKEQLWPHLQEFVVNLIDFYGQNMPEFVTSHYADGGYCAVLFQEKTGIGFTFTGHSLGAQKLDKLGTNLQNLDSMERRYHFSQRIEAERLAMEFSSSIITSTKQEHKEQYAHALYHGAVSVDDEKFSVIPPGVNLNIFNRETNAGDEDIQARLAGSSLESNLPYVLVSSRLDEKKNILGVVEAYAQNKALQEKAGLAICVRGINDPFESIESLSTGEQKVLKPILELISGSGIRNRVIFLNIQSQRELAATYRYFSTLGSVFALTAFYEPFGLAPIEAAACGLVCVATKNGGPSEIFEDGSGILVDPFNSADIAQGLIKALENPGVLSEKSYQRVISKYTWDKTAKGYIEAINASRTQGVTRTITSTNLDNDQRLTEYLQHQSV